MAKLESRPAIIDPFCIIQFNFPHSTIVLANQFIEALERSSAWAFDWFVTENSDSLLEHPEEEQWGSITVLFSCQEDRDLMSRQESTGEIYQAFASATGKDDVVKMLFGKGGVEIEETQTF